MGGGGIASPGASLSSAGGGGHLSSAVKPLVNHNALSRISPSLLFSLSLPVRSVTLLDKNFT